MGTLIIHSSRNSSGPAPCWAMLGSQQGIFLVPVLRGLAGWVEVGCSGRDPEHDNPGGKRCEGEAQWVWETWLWQWRPRVNVC